uniref:RNA-directed DNA polymerase, eukaryota n=1 Tax=Tanacetum cinerariifolium TaxID=118510 RepID=A0A6L2NPP6_TANCI|nr:hypothetical protein [Tanacetum cinerariifolium]
MDINIDALYNILKQNQGDVNDDMGLRKKNVVVTSDPLTLIAEKKKVSKRKEKLIVSSNSEGSDADDFSELKKITALIRRRRYNLISAELKFKNLMLDHQDKYMMKAQHILRGRLLASFQDLEHEGGVTRIARRHEIQG